MNFDPKNPRVKLAEEKKFFNNLPFTILVILLFLVLLSGGVALIFLKNPFAWTLIGLATIPTIVLFWIKTALKEIPPINSNHFTDLISEDLLKLLKDKRLQVKNK